MIKFLTEALSSDLFLIVGALKIFFEAPTVFIEIAFRTNSIAVYFFILNQYQDESVSQHYANEQDHVN